jgi:hypothetical protein
MASELSVKDAIDRFIRENRSNDLKMIIGLQLEDLTNSSRRSDNIHNVDVILNNDNNTGIYNVNGRNILVLNIDFNERDQLMQLKHFGVSNIKPKNNDLNNNIFGKFREIIFDYSTVKFIKDDHFTIGTLLFIFTILLNENGKLFIPNLMETLMRFESVFSSYENASFEGDRLVFRGNKFVIPRNKVRSGSKTGIANDYDIFEYNYNVMRTHQFNVLKNKEINYPILYKGNNVAENYYIIDNKTIPLIHISSSTSILDMRTIISKIQTENLMIKRFYELRDTKNKYLYKYLKYKNKYLKLKNNS